MEGSGEVWVLFSDKILIKPSCPHSDGDLLSMVDNEADDKCARLLHLEANPFEGKRAPIGQVQKLNTDCNALNVVAKIRRNSISTNLDRSFKDVFHGLACLYEKLDSCVYKQWDRLEVVSDLWGTKMERSPPIG